MSDRMRSNLRAALHVHGANFRLHPAHGLQRGEVVADLHTAAEEVLLLKDGHATALVGLRGGTHQLDCGALRELWLAT